MKVRKTTHYIGHIVRYRRCPVCGLTVKTKEAPAQFYRPPAAAEPAEKAETPEPTPPQDPRPDTKKKRGRPRKKK